MVYLPPCIFISFAMISNNKLFQNSTRIPGLSLPISATTFSLRAHGGGWKWQNEFWQNLKVTQYLLEMKWSPHAGSQFSQTFQGILRLDYQLVDSHTLIIFYLLIPIRWNCLPAMTSAWHFKDTLRNETKNFLISIPCSPWLIYTLTPSNFTHYYLILSKLPFNTETIKKFRAEKKTTETLRIYTVTWQSTFGEFISPHQRTEIFLYDSIYYWRLVILWTLGTCVFYVEQSSMSRVLRKQKRRWTMGMSFDKRGGVSQYTGEIYGHEERKGHPRIVWKLEETVLKL